MSALLCKFALTLVRFELALIEGVKAIPSATLAKETHGECGTQGGLAIHPDLAMVAMHNFLGNG